jgi:hypothetical protein
MNIRWRIDHFVGYGRKVGSRTIDVSRRLILNKQQLNYNNRGIAVNGVLYSVRAKCLQNKDVSGGRIE